MPYNYGNYNGYWSGGVNTVPTPYQQNYTMQQPVQQPQVSYAPNYAQASNNNGINWVQGRAGANSFYVAPGQSALLMDSEDSVLYVKSVDISGRPMPLEVYDLIKRDNVIDAPQISQRNQPQQTTGQPPQDMRQYVTMAELESKVSELVNKALEG